MCASLSRKGEGKRGEAGMDRLGFIGVGRMGGPMARRLLADGYKLTVYDSSPAAVKGVGEAGGRRGGGRLLADGYKLTVYDSSPAAVKGLVEAGADAAGSIAEVAEAAETVLVSLPTPAIVEEVASAVAAAGGKVKNFVDLSTTGPRVAQ